MLLIKFRDNWADEFDVSGWFVSSEEVWDAFKAQPFEPTEIYFGTNEGIEYESKSDYLSHFKTTSISDSDAEVLVRLFGATLKLEQDDQDQDQDDDNCNESYFDLRPYGDVLNAFER